MNKQTDHRSVVIAFFAVAILFTAAQTLSAPLGSASSFIASAFARYIMFAGGNADAAGEPEAASAESELERLRAALAKSDSEIRHLSETLRSVTDFKAGYDVPVSAVVVAEVLMRNDASNFRRSLIISRGRKDGILPGMVAVSGVAQSPERGLSGALIGRVISVSDTSSRVLLISDPAMRTPVLILETNEEGVVEGTPTSEFPLTVKYIDAASTVKVGDRIVTSTTVGDFPRGLLLGTVAAIPNRGYGPFLTVRVKPALNLERISHVLILKTSTQSLNEGEK